MTAACLAAANSLVFYPDGSARVCCISNQVLGYVTQSTLSDIWFGATRAELDARLAVNDFSMGCEGCGTEIAVEGRPGSYAAGFDRFGAPRDSPVDGSWPRSIYFNLSNVCNLQCVQCDGELSSSIRRHREHLPALPMVYGDRFFEELRSFIPHLEEAEFAGGEPFLAPETYRVLDLIHELNPELTCKVITNGTQWNHRVEAALDRHRFHVKVSIDSVTADAARLRVGSDIDEVLVNLERFRRYTERAGTRIEISHCVMPQNVAAFPDLLVHAEAMGIPVGVSVVRDPAEFSLAHLDADAIGAIHRSLLARDAEMTRRLVVNLDVWRTELARIGAWAAHPTTGIRGHDEHRVMWFQRDGAGPTSGDDARRELAQRAVDGHVYEVRVGPGQTITRLVGDLEPLLDADADELVGHHVRNLFPRLTDRFGAVASMAGVRIVHQDDDRVDQVATFPSATLLISTVALRDLHGHADEACMLIARSA